MRWFTTVTIKIPDENKVITDQDEAGKLLSQIGIQYERWKADVDIGEDASPQQVLDAYSVQVEELKKERGYRTADVIDINPGTPGIDAMLAKFNKEHWHDEDEVRFTIAGRGIFYIHPVDKPITIIEVGKGDLIRIPKNTHHWFDLCEEKRIRAIRLFQNVSGWSPYYTGSNVDSMFQPLCMGPSYFPPR